jgi:hypothetical protein
VVKVFFVTFIQMLLLNCACLAATAAFVLQSFGLKNYGGGDGERDLSE